MLLLNLSLVKDFCEALGSDWVSLVRLLLLALEGWAIVGCCKAEEGEGLLCRFILRSVLERIPFNMLPRLGKWYHAI